MEPTDLVKLCNENIEWCNQHGFTPALQLTLPEGSPGSKYRQPFGPKGPKARILQWGIPDGRDTVAFDTVELLAFLKESAQEGN